MGTIQLLLFSNAQTRKRPGSGGLSPLEMTEPQIMKNLIQWLFVKLTPNDPAKRKTLQYWLGTFAVVCAFASLLISYNVPACRAFVLCIWAIAPPMYFWYEYYWLYDPATSLDQFKYGQEVSRNIWAGVLAALIALKITGEVQSPSDAQPRSKDSGAQAAQHGSSPTPPPTSPPPTSCYPTSGDAHANADS
jgi:hypothetical protein